MPSAGRGTGSALGWPSSLRRRASSGRGVLSGGAWRSGPMLCGRLSAGALARLAAACRGGELASGVQGDSLEPEEGWWLHPSWP